MIFFAEKSSVPQQLKITFLSCFIAGLFAHFYMITNKLPNYDDINCLTTYGAGVASGRFAIAIIGKVIRVLFGNYSLPWLHGLVSIFLISTAAAFVTDLLHIEHALNCIFIGALLIVSPAMTGTFFFMFTVPYYCFSILLIVFSVWVIVRHVKLMVISSFIFAISIGIYQAYFPFATGLLLLVLLQRCFAAEEITSIVREALLYLFFLILGLILYIGMSKICLLLLEETLTTYQGLNEMEHLPISQLPELIGLAYKNYFLYLTQNIKGMNPYPFIRILMILLHFIILGSIFVSSKSINIKCNPGHALLLKISIFIGVILFPITVNLIYVMSKNGNVYSIMMYPSVLILLLAVMIIDQMEFDELQHMFSPFIIKFRICISWIASCIFLVTIFAQIYFANVQYLAMHMQYEQAFSYFATMLTQIKMVPGYTDKMPLVIIGNDIVDDSFYENNYFTETLTGRSDTLINVFCRNEFLRTYMGFDQIIMEDTIQWAQLEEVKNMPCYPNNNSICVINGAIILKLND